LLFSFYFTKLLGHFFFYCFDITTRLSCEREELYMLICTVNWILCWPPQKATLDNLRKSFVICTLTAARTHSVQTFWASWDSRFKKPLWWVPCTIGKLPREKPNKDTGRELANALSCAERGKWWCSDPLTGEKRICPTFKALTLHRHQTGDKQAFFLF